MFLVGIHNYPVTIAASGSLSGPIATGVDTLVGIQMPAAWVAAGVTFQVSFDGGTTWAELYDDDGVEVTITSPPAGSFVLMSSRASYAWRAVNMFKVRSGTAVAPVIQTADAIVTLIGRPEQS